MANPLARPAVGQMPWVTMTWRVTLSFVILTIVGTMVGVMVEGSSAAGGFVSGVALVYLSFAISIGIVRLGERRSRTGVAKALLLAYFFKAVLLGPLLLAAPIPDAYRNGWMLTAAVLAVLLQLLMEAWAISSQRLLYFDTAP